MSLGSVRPQPRDVPRPPVSGPTAPGTAAGATAGDAAAGTAAPAVPKAKEAGVQKGDSAFAKTDANPYSTKTSTPPPPQAPVNKAAMKVAEDREAAELSSMMPKTATKREQGSVTAEKTGSKQPEAKSTRGEDKKADANKKADGGKKTFEKKAEFKKEAKAEVKTSRGDGKNADAIKKEMEGGKKIYEKKGSAEVKKEAKAEFNESLAKTSLGDLSHEGKVEASVKAKVGGGVEVTSKGISVKGDAELEAGVRGDYKLKFKSKEFTIAGEKMRADFTLNLSAEAVARAKGQVEVAVAAGPPPKAVVKLGGEVFAGVQAGAELTGNLTWIKDKGKEVSLVKATVGGSVRAGIGAGAGLNVGYDGGKLNLEAYAGVTLGIGGSVKGKAEIDTKEAGEFIKKVGADKIKDFVIDKAKEYVVDKAKDLALDAVGGGVGGAVDLIKQGQLGVLKKLTRSDDVDPKKVAEEVKRRALAGNPVRYDELIQMFQPKTSLSDNLVRAAIAPWSFL